MVFQGCVIVVLCAGPVELRSEVGSCLGQQVYWGGKLCQGKKRRKGEGKSEKIEESEKRKERKRHRKIQKKNVVNGPVSL